MTWIKPSNPKRKWWVLAAMTSCISMTFLDQSILPVALPTINRELHISELGMQWLINSYLLAVTAFVLAGGRLGDMVGHRKIFSIGTIIFAISSIFCGLSYSTGWFVAGRLLQGVGGALIIPTAASLLASAFPPEQQGRAFGFYVSVGAFFAALGPVVGGFFTQYLTWRYCFWINLPIAAIGLILTFLSIPKSKKQDESFDYLGFVTIAIGVSCVTVGLMQGENWGWTSWLVPTLVIFGIFLILALAIFDRDVKDPFIDFKLFRDPGYVAANSCVFATQFLLMLTIFWAIYNQTVLNYSPTLSGFMAMLATSPIILFSHLGGYLSDRFGPKLPIIIGFSLVIFGISWFVFVPIPPTPLMYLPVIVPFGCGIPLIFLPSFTLSMAKVPPHKRGVAVGINMTLRQFSAVLGMATFGQIFLNLHNRSFSKKLLSDEATAGINPSNFEGLLAHAEPAVNALKSLPKDVASKVYEDFFSAYVASSTMLNIIGISMGIAGLLSALFLLKWGLHLPQKD